MLGIFDAIQDASMGVYGRQSGGGDLPPPPPAGTLYVVSETGAYVVQGSDYVTEEI
jgi:hypothetical protein